MARRYQQTKRAQQAAQTREKIVEAATRVYERDGFEASMNAVAEEAGVAPGTVHHHFESPEALMAAVARRFTDVELPSVEQVEACEDPASALRLVLFELYRVFEETEGLYRQWTALNRRIKALEDGEQSFYVQMSAALTAAVGELSPEQMQIVFALASPGTHGSLRQVGMTRKEAADAAAVLIERYLEVE